MKPFCAIYSTFLQRAYDQVVHDVAIQSLPVRFALDRAGPVGTDGATHSGSFDLAYLGCLPGFVLMAPSDEAELMHAVATAVVDRRPAVARCAIRAATAWGVRCRPAARCGRWARDAWSAKAAAWRSCRWDRGWRMRCGRPMNWRRVDCRRPSPMLASPNRWIRRWSSGWRDIMRCSLRSRRDRSAASDRRCCITWRGKDCWTAGLKVTADGVAGLVHRPRLAGQAACRGEADGEGHRGNGAGRVRPEGETATDGERWLIALAALAVALSTIGVAFRLSQAGSWCGASLLGSQPVCATAAAESISVLQAAARRRAVAGGGTGQHLPAGLPGLAGGVRRVRIRGRHGAGRGAAACRHGFPHCDITVVVDPTAHGPNRKGRQSDQHAAGGEARRAGDRRFGPARGAGLPAAAGGGAGAAGDRVW